MTLRHIIIAFVGILLLGGGAFFLFPHEAQTKETVSASSSGEASPWNVRCDDVEGNVKSRRNHCEMFQRLSVKDTGQRLVEFAIGYPDDAEMARGILILPLGILLENGVQMHIDDDKAFKFGVRYCDGNGCFAFISLKPDVLDALKRGHEAKIIFQALSGEGVQVNMSLKGFTKALKELGV